MNLLTFKGGLHPDDHKRETANIPIVDLTPSKIMIYPMSQHIGAPCNPIVAVGDRVLMGQVIGTSICFCAHSLNCFGKGCCNRKKTSPQRNKRDVGCD